MERYTYTLPTVLSVTPRSGPAAGGTPVSITGRDFYPDGGVPGFTTVYFGSAQATNVKVPDPDHLTAVAPAGSGWVSVSAATAEGHGPPGAHYKYPRREAAPLPARGSALSPPASAPPVPGQSTPRVRPTPPPPTESAGSFIRSMVLRLLRFLLSR
jgi:IPT/TIG domain-containing protein